MLPSTNTISTRDGDRYVNMVIVNPSPEAAYTDTTTTDGPLTISYFEPSGHSLDPGSPL